MADLPHYHLGSDLASKINPPWGCAIPQEPWVMLLWATLIEFEQKIWGCSAWEHSLLPTTDQPSLLVSQSTQKSSGPSAPGAREHNLPPAPSQEEQKAFFFPPACSC